jgi:flagellar biogenesis protein FliO
MRQVLIAFLLCCAYFAIGAEVSNVKVTGQDRAELSFLGDLPAEPPTWKISDNTLELMFSGTHLAPEHGGKLELESPHALIKRLSLYSSGDNNLKGKIVLNGSMEGIKKRIQMGRSGKDLVLAVDYPKTESATLKLMQEEQIPLTGLAVAGKSEGSRNYRTAVLLVLFVLLSLGLGAFIFVRFVKNKGGLSGTRRYLIEQLGYYPMGAKAGVSLLRIGKEFVLVGVTPNSINIISHLPKLQEQYEEESGFERGVFKQAIAEEVQRLK